jgi:hypothetical protein
VTKANGPKCCSKNLIIAAGPLYQARHISSGVSKAYLKVGFKAKWNLSQSSELVSLRGIKTLSESIFLGGPE